MHLTRVVIKNYRAIRDATVEFQRGLTIVVGDNETGKSTLLEAIHLAISGRLGGRGLRNQLHSFLFNTDACREYAVGRSKGTVPLPPEILIEVYFSDDDELVRLKGTNNSRREDCPGISLRIALAEHLGGDFSEYIAATADPHLLPTEFFEVDWFSFAGEPLYGRRSLFKSTLIGTTTGDARQGTTRYLTSVMGEHLPDDEQLQLSLAYRSMKQQFQNHATVKKLNAELLTRRGEVSSKALSIGMDMTGSNDWDHGITPLLDDIPFDLIGRGEQASARLWLAVNTARKGADLVMVEEPETHLSHARLNELIDRISTQLVDRQLIVTTHSSFVVNKLGLSEVLLFNKAASLRLTDLNKDTAAYFKKLPGHDTLRMVLAKRVILVEGPSDELIVQRAYRDFHGKRPIADGVDVLAVRALAFVRYLDISMRLQKPVVVLIDNDGEPDSVQEKYGKYNGVAYVNICFSKDASARTLEPLLVGANTLDRMNRVLGKNFADKEAAVRWMTNDKTEAALRIHDSVECIEYPECIANAVR